MYLQAAIALLLSILLCSVRSNRPIAFAKSRKVYLSTHPLQTPQEALSRKPDVVGYAGACPCRRIQSRRCANGQLVYPSPACSQTGRARLAGNWHGHETKEVYRYVSIPAMDFEFTQLYQGFVRTICLTLWVHYRFTSKFMDPLYIMLPGSVNCK